MIDNEQVDKLQELFRNSDSLLIIYPPNSSLDIQASAAGLFSILDGLGKRVSLASPVQPNSLDVVGLDKTVTEIGNQNLVVSFDYIEEAIDKVSYHIGEDDQKFYLTIKPRAGFPPLTADSVDFSYSGLDTEVLILVGVKSLEDLEHLYYGYEEIYERAALVNINSSIGRSGIVEINTDGGESVSQCLADVLLNTEFYMSDNVATNLLRGIEETTQHFTSLSATADTFEVASRLMRLGARRSRPGTRSQQAVQPAQAVEMKATQAPRETQAKKPGRPKLKTDIGSLNHQPGEGAPKGG